MADGKVITTRPTSPSPPPNCAICLGSCSNKCFSDSCMHQFCFKCLLEWSKIKAECPLCKQPFKSIIHNVKSNEEYDEHVVETTHNEEIHIIDNEEFLFLPLPNTPHLPHRHQFHFRTTFTVDTRGEHAIQQMLLTHPLTNGQITFGAGYPARNIFRRRRDFSATSFRRSIYARNLWVNSLPDVTGRYRDISPSYFRSNATARQRLVPWLNRELNALLFENTQLIMRLVDIIMDQLLCHHICSRTFRNLLREYLDSKTDHFVHEFYNFMRSPFDMVGYDRHVIYTERPHSPAPYIDVSDNDNDSDVIIVGASNPSEPVVIDLVNSDDSDEPVIVSADTQVPMPILPQSPPTAPTIVNLPPKLRLKHKALQEKEKWRKIKKRHRHRSRSSSSSSSSDERERATYRRYKRRKLQKKMRLKRREDVLINSSESTEINISTSDTDDDKPLIDIIKKKWKDRERLENKKAVREDSHTVTSSSTKDDFKIELPRLEPIRDLPGCSYFSSDSSVSQSVPRTSYSIRQDCHEVSKSSNNTTGSSTVVLPCINTQGDSSKRLSNSCLLKSEEESSNDNGYNLQHMVKSEVREVKRDDKSRAGPSRMKNLILRKEDNKWYSYGGIYDSDSSDN